MDKSIQLKQRFYPEATMGGFSQVDSSVEFYNRIAALLKPTDRVLDFGAGRGGQISDDPIPYRQSLKTLRGRCARIDACDLDPEVLENPFVDEAKILESPSAPLPYENGTFDLIFCSWVFEHIDDPEASASELLRILKPGGFICAMTPNKWGYIARAATLAGNANHAKLLRRIQPSRNSFDTFPTRYKLNRPSAIQRCFGARADVVVYSTSGEPAYHFNNSVIFAGLKLLHRLLPSALNTTLFIFIHKR